MLEKITLTYKDGGLYPDIKSVVELRARTVLAYIFEQNIISPHIITDQKTGEQAVILAQHDNDKIKRDEHIWIITQPINTGFIYVADSSKGWKEQPNRMFLHLSKDINVDSLLRFYFQASLRWLNDSPKTLNALAQIFKG